MAEGNRLDMPRDRGRRPQVDHERFGRLSERAARYIGSWGFIAWMTFVILLWLLLNIAAPEGMRPDEYPFIFLTLLLSLQASYAAPLILLAQNRQTDRDRVQYQEDRQRTERLLADSDYLAIEIASLRSAVGEVATRDFLRGEIKDLMEEIVERLDRLERKAEEQAPPSAAQ